MSNAVAVIHKKTIQERIAAGEYMKDIAADLGVSPAAISQVLSKDPEYLAARESGIESRLEKYQKDIDTAADQLNLARAREGFRAQAWRAERECPQRWGVKQDQQSSFGSTGIVINIGDVKQGVTIDQGGEG